MPVMGAHGKEIVGKYALLNSTTAVMEMAVPAGLPLMGNNKDPLHATTYGVGQMILDASKRGVKNIVLGLGGSATNDGGISMASALGYRFLEKKGKELEAIANNLGKIHTIEIPENLPKISVIAACDVTNPLCGETGATYVYGPQKGVTPDMAKTLDAGMKNLATVMERTFKKDVRNIEGAGAAGGLGAGVIGFLGGTLKPGIETLLDIANFDEQVKDATMVFTGEGRIDGQSIYGKVPVGVSRRAKRANVPCIALCGSIGDDVEKVYDEGITAVFAAVAKACDFDGIKKSCEADMYALAVNVVRVMGCL